MQCDPERGAGIGAPPVDGLGWAQPGNLRLYSYVKVHLHLSLGGFSGSHPPPYDEGMLAHFL